MFKQSKIHKSKPLNVFGIIFFLTLGLTFILNLIGVIPWDVWGIILRLWPVLLLMLILQIFSKKIPAAPVVISALGIGLTLAIIFLSISSQNSRFELIRSLRKLLKIEVGERLSSQLVVKDTDFPNVSERIINLKLDAGTFNLTDNFGTDHLIINSEYFEKVGKPSLSTRLDNKTLYLNFNAEGNLNYFLGAIEDTKYDFSVGSAEIPTELNLAIGAALFNAKFKNLNLNSFNLKVGAGRADVSFNKSSLPRQNLEAEVGGGSLKLTLPFDVFAKVKYFVGAGNLKINNQTFRGEGIYTTPNFQITEDPLEITIKLGAGAVFIDTTGNE